MLSTNFLTFFLSNQEPYTSLKLLIEELTLVEQNRELRSHLISLPPGFETQDFKKGCILPCH